MPERSKMEQEIIDAFGREHYLTSLRAHDHYLAGTYVLIDQGVPKEAICDGLILLSEMIRHLGLPPRDAFLNKMSEELARDE